MSRAGFISVMNILANTLVGVIENKEIKYWKKSSKT